MNCPFCFHAIAPAWQPLSVTTDELGRSRQPQVVPQIVSSVPIAGTQCQLTVTAQWLICQNPECKQIVMQVTRLQYMPKENGKHVPADLQSWLAVPKLKCPPALDPLVTGPMRKDYIEAHTILDDSPRMSSVLSRRMLADLLKQYANLIQFRLEDRIDAFVKDTTHPRRIRENLHYLREMGNFGAHSQEQANAPAAPTATTEAVAADPIIIDVDKSEAEWALKVVADLFDYFIVAPAKDAERRKEFDKKIADANRKPIKPLTA